MADKPEDDDMPVPVPEVPAESPPADGETKPEAGAEEVKGAEPPPPPPAPEAAAEPPHSAKKSIVPDAEGDGKKTKRRASMFAEATEAKDLIAFAPGGDIQSTLQAFFKEKSTSVENIPVKRLRRPKLIYENTYRLESKKPFVSSRVEPLINKTLEDMLENVVYSSKTVHTLSSHIAEKIRNRVLALDYERFKIVVHVAIGTMSRQGVFMACKTVSDPNRDSYAIGNFKNHFLFATATVHAMYYE